MMRTRSGELREQLIRWQANAAAKPVLHGSLTLAQVLLMGCAVWMWHQGRYDLLAVVWVLSVVVNHNKLIAFHETAHGLLQPIRWLNEFIGQVLGCATMVPLTAYRIVHNRHHAYLGTARDDEFWPFVDTTVPRWKRVLAVSAELFLGYFYDPIVFARGVFAAEDIPTDQRKRVVREYVACALHWAAVAAILTWFGWWREFCVAFFIPGYVAASINSWRRMIEHLGMLGDTVETKTRMIVPAGLLSKAVSEAALHVGFHSTHHRYARIPYYHLPEATQVVYGDDASGMKVFPSYWSALRDMLPHLADPRIGAQWLAAATPAAKKAA